MNPKVTLALLVLTCSVLPVAAEIEITSVNSANQTISLNWRGGFGPYLVETSQYLADWSDQGEPAMTQARSLPPFARRGFYRVKDLNPADQYGAFFGLVQTDQGEFGGILARHRLKSRFWLYKTKGEPHTAASFTSANYFRKLLLNYQYHEGGVVRTWSGVVEDLGTVATPTNQSMTISWTRGSGSMLQSFVLTLNFPYSITGNRSTIRPSDPTYELRCTRATAERELQETLVPVTVDQVGLVQLDPENANQAFPQPRQYQVSQNGTRVNLHFREGRPLFEGSPPFSYKTFLLDAWLSPSTFSGPGLPDFSTDSYFSRTLLPGHHNFVENVLIEPALDPALPEETRMALAAANIRYIHVFKDLDIGLAPDKIRYIGFDNTLRDP